MAEKLAYSVHEACTVIGIGRTRLYEEIKSGRIMVRKIGRRTLIPAASLTSFLEG